MNWEAAGAVGEIVGALGVLATLLYVAAQIRENTQSLQATSLQTVLDGCRDRYFLPMARYPEMGDIFSRGLNSLGHLDGNETRRFFYQMYEQLFQMQQVLALRDRNLISQTDYDAWLHYTTSLLRTPGGAEIYPHCEKVLTPNIANVLNEELARHPENPSFIELIPIFERDDEETTA